MNVKKGEEDALLASASSSTEKSTVKSFVLSPTSIVATSSSDFATSDDSPKITTQISYTDNSTLDSSAKTASTRHEITTQPELSEGTSQLSTTRAILDDQIEESESASSNQSQIVVGVSVGVAILILLVIVAAVTYKYRQAQTKPVYSEKHVQVNPGFGFC